MGLILLLTLSLLFGWAFTYHYKIQLELLQSKLDLEKKLRERDGVNHEFIVKKLQATIRELL